MMIFRFTDKGNFNNTERFLTAMQNNEMFAQLSSYGAEGVAMLAASTPHDTGRTADAWDYTIEVNSDHARIQWYNHNTNKGFNVAIGLQYGHGTGTGGYVVGRDFINPTMRPVFDDLTARVWATVVNA